MEVGTGHIGRPGLGIEFGVGPGQMGAGTGAYGLDTLACTGIESARSRLRCGSPPIVSRPSARISESVRGVGPTQRLTPESQVADTCLSRGGAPSLTPYSLLPWSPRQILEGLKVLHEHDVLHRGTSAISALGARGRGKVWSRISTCRGIVSCSILPVPEAGVVIDHR